MTWVAGLIGGALAAAAPVQYTIDPEHTYPSFEASHRGISIWRGKFNKTSDTVKFDKASGHGSVNVVVDLGCVDFGHDKLNSYMVGPEFFDTVKFPHATYLGTFAAFANGSPTPVASKINSFTCIPHPLLKREVCGADALATFERDDFQLDAGKSYGFSMDVTLRIQVEARKDS